MILKFNYMKFKGKIYTEGLPQLFKPLPEIFDFPCHTLYFKTSENKSMCFIISLKTTSGTLE